MAIKQISSCPSLAPRFHAPPPAPSYRQTRKVAGTRRAKNKRKRCSVFSSKQDTAPQSPFHVLVFVFLCMPHRWLIGFAIVLLECYCGCCGTNSTLALRVFFFFFFFLMQDKEKKKKNVLFPELQRGVASRNLCHRDMLRECLMSSFKCQPAHKRSRVVICFKDFKSWPWRRQRLLGSPVRPFIGPHHHCWYVL